MTTSTRRFVTLLFSLVFTAGMARASTITLVSAGNGVGLTDGANYAGLVTLIIDGKTYSAICIDSLHGVEVGDTWSGNLTSLTDNVALTPAVQAQFGVDLTPGVFNPKLGADVVAYYMMLTNPDSDSVISLQHSAWGQFDTRYDGHTLAALAVDILASGSMVSGNGRTLVSINSFDIVTDSSNVRQAFLVSATADPVPEPVTMGLMGGGLVLLGLLRRPRLKMTFS